MLLVALRLGVTSFGGPVAHLGYFREEYVRRRGWVDERSYGDIVALSQFLPGPASSQVGIAIGMLRAGLAGGIAAWAAFTLPSALLMVAFAFGLEAFDVAEAGWLHGLKVVAVAVVANAVWGMARTLTPDLPRIALAAAAAAVLIASTTAATQVAVIAGGALLGWLLPGGARIEGVPEAPWRPRVGTRSAAACLVTFFALLLVLPALRGATGNTAVAVVDSFYRVGSLVFGGGHVVLPLLQAEVVPPGWVTEDQFVAGYGAAQAVPGPLFSFAAYLGAAMGPAPGGPAGAAIALVAIYVPSFLLVIGVLPFWARIRARTGVQRALRGVNAAVVGILAAALYDPVWTSAIFGPQDVALAAAAFALLLSGRVPPWLVVLFAAAAGQLLSLL